MTEIEKQIINLAEIGFSRKEILNNLNCDSLLVKKHVKRNNGSKTTITEKERDQIIENYLNGESIYKLQKDFNLNYQRIKKILENRNIEIRPQKRVYYYNNYFKEIDSHEKAYYLGLIMADGCLSKCRNYTYHKDNMSDKVGKFSISLQYEDKYLVDGLAKALNAECHLRDINKGGGRQTQRHLGFQCNELGGDLYKHGVRQNKSKNGAVLPQTFSSRYMNSFLLGFFDGDGTVSYSLAEDKKNKTNNFFYIKHYIGIIGTDVFCKELELFLKNNVTNEYISWTKETSKFQNNLWSIFLKSRAGILDFYNYVYGDSPIYMIRKKEKMEDILFLSERGSRIDKVKMNNLKRYK